MEDKELIDILISRHPEKEGLLKAMFPDLDKTPFLRPGIIFRKKDSANSYIILMDRDNREYLMANITLGYTFKARIKVSHRDNGLPITMGQLHTLSGNNSKQYFK